nr:MAG TPA: hypothetical protein [Caudoviricetes sp.]
MLFKRECKNDVSRSCSDNGIIAQCLVFVNTKPHFFCVFGQFIPFGGLDIRKVLVGRGRLQRRSYFFDFSLVGYDYVLIHSLVIVERRQSVATTTNHRQF